MIDQRQCFVEMYLQLLLASGVRSIQMIAQWDIDYSCVGIVKESQPCDQSAVSEGRPLELLQERSDTIPGACFFPTGQLRNVRIF